MHNLIHFNLEESSLEKIKNQLSIVHQESWIDVNSVPYAKISTCNGIQKSYNMNSKETHNLSNLVSKIIHQNVDGLPYYENDIKPGSVWTVDGKDGTYHRTHNHTSDIQARSSSNLCCVIYLETTHLSGGDIFFVGNFGPEQKYAAYHFSPKMGDVFVFSPELYHGTYPQVGGSRKTLNLDFYWKI